MRKTQLARLAAVVLLLSAASGFGSGCGGDDSVFQAGDDASDDAADASSGDDASFTFQDGGSSGGDGSLGQCDSGCAAGARCKYDTCVPDLGTCTTNDNCPGDSYCDTDGTCVPYGVPPSKVNDPSCARPIDPGGVEPTVQCEWTSPIAADGGDAGDPTAAYVNVYSTPVVADLNLDNDPKKLQPSVVLTTWADVGERIGVLRVFDGRTCGEQMRIGGPDDPDVENNRPAYGTQWAIGDLDGDVGNGLGHPEIVGLHRTAGAIGTNPKLQPIAFAVDSSVSPPKLVRKWLGRVCSQDGGADTPFIFPTNSNLANYGPGLWDLDDDGKPEVIVDAYVFDSNGCLLNSNPPPIDLHYLDHGVLSTVADVDLDGKPDLVRGDGVYGWDTSAKQWTLKSYFTQTAANLQGHVAVANVGSYSVIPGKQPTDPLPEIIVVSADPGAGNTYPFNPNGTGTLRVQTLTGQVVFGPYPLFHYSQGAGGHGGAPTAADFDGDGQVEFAAAANEFYAVYDPDCVGTAPDGGTAARPGGKCTRPPFMTQYATGAAFDAGPAPLDGLLWARPSSDFSSSETGSSIFDFNGDGKGEAVYRDECYLRVYEGATGDVIFSAPASSGTGQEEPVICDVDGDFATEIVVARAANGPNVGNGAGQCRAQDTLFDAGPEGGATYTKQGGFEILRDPLDRWTASRPIWNQHAYSITNVTDDGRVPRSSQMLRNWEQPGLNNFRQNTQGELGKLALADLTATLQDLSGLCSGKSGNVTLNTRVCNRGTNPVQDGVPIAFYSSAQSDAGFDAAAATQICSAPTSVLLQVGECTDVTCTGFLGAGQDVYVVVDPNKTVADCHPGNNQGASARVLCPSVK